MTRRTEINNIPKDVIDTIYKISNVCEGKGLEVNDFEVRTKDVFMNFNSPYSIGQNQDVDDMVLLETTYCGLCDRYEIYFYHKVGKEINSKIVELVNKINSESDCGKVKVNRCQWVYYIYYTCDIDNMSQNMDSLDDVLTNYLNNCKKYIPLMRQCKSDESLETSMISSSSHRE